MAVALAMYLVNTIVFNITHLRLKNTMVAWWLVFTLMVYQIALGFVNAASVYWTSYKRGTDGTRVKILFEYWPPGTGNEISYS
jgi:hypothetical protein